MYIYGIHPVEELLLTVPEKVLKIFCEDPSATKFAEIRKIAESHGMKFVHADADELDRIAEDGNHQGVVVHTTPFEYDSLDNILRMNANESRACVMVLDQIQDPQNLGAIIRSAVALGVTGIIIPKRRAASVTPAVVRASAGQALKVRVAIVTNIAQTLEKLKKDGWWTVGAAAGEQSTDLWKIDFDMKTALVMGSEHQGLRRLVAEKCDFQVRIPMASGVDSLNVASAASIMLYEVRRQWAAL